MEAPIWPNYFLRAPPLNTITLQVRMLTHKFWGRKHLVHCTMFFCFVYILTLM